ncbi:hypothetical protein GCM10027169_05900 [Gordonia jinhuaensis]|uniref:Lipoprotein n=1 Tax=Gordonia jinhuaensis TaxID=1517702 RepID=A0A916SVT2_9ACTN|nr:hypothetical protein [Gordonia jinhuaensis]GGB20322.1 hypothetical protein GCM10011489_05510 [Gordonia jinhuaensis]
MTGWIGRGVAAAAMVVIGAGALAGCGGGGDKSSAASSSAQIAGAPIPADFPREDVPLLDGLVQSAGGDAADGWNFTIQGDAGSGNALANSEKKLEAAGYTRNSSATQGGAKVDTYTRKRDGVTYYVSVGATPNAAGGPNSVFYQVSKG